MKRKLWILVSLVLVFATLAAPALGEVVKTPAIDGSLNLRGGPGTGYAVVGWVKNGQSITVLEHTSPWAKIQVDSNGKVGYINTKYIAAGTGTTTPVTPALPNEYELGAVSTRYASSVVNVRMGAGTQYVVVAKLKSGACLSILGESGNWLEVKSGGVHGYISKNYVSDGCLKQLSANVNFRQGPGTSYASNAVLAKGARVKAMSVSGNWTLVDVNGTDGYVYSKYLK